MLSFQTDSLSYQGALNRQRYHLAQDFYLGCILGLASAMSLNVVVDKGQG